MSRWQRWLLDFFFIATASAETEVRIVGGEPALQNEFPYQVSVQKFHVLGGGWRNVCGGSILNEEWILSAAHCIVDDDDAAWYRIVAGELSLKEVEGSEQIRFVDKVINHPDYDNDAKVNDIGLIRLNESLSVNNVSTAAVKLPVRGIEPPVGTKCVVTGWGKTNHNGFDSSKLLKVEVPIISDEECDQSYAKWGGIVDYGVICAGNTSHGGVDACQGDSGGPLVSTVDQTQVGIVSAGVDCAEPEFPGVYTQLEHYIPFIAQNVPGLLPTMPTPALATTTAAMEQNGPY